MFFIKQARYHAVQLAEKLLSKQLELNNLLSIWTPSFCFYLGTAYASFYLQTKNTRCVVYSFSLSVAPIVDLIHHCFIEHISDDSIPCLTSFTISFFRQLLWKRPGVLFKQEEVISLPSLFVEYLYILLGRNEASERGCLVMLLSLFLHLPHESLQGDCSYLPSLQNETALSVINRWKEGDLSSFGLSDTTIQQYYEESSNNELENELSFSEFCLSLPLLLESHIDMTPLFALLLKVSIGSELLL